MPNRKSYWRNAYESALALELASGSTSMTVADGSALPSEKFYLVIEPNNATQREYVWVGTRSGNILNGLERNLLGSAGDVTHPVNSTVRTVALAQGFEDLHERVDANQSAVPNHEADPDPHSQYLQLAGGTMAGVLTLADASPAASQAYADQGVTDHEAAADPHTQYLNVARADVLYAPIAHVSNADAHHTRYTDAEAIAATSGVYLPVDGNAATATKLQTARTISLAGDVTGSVNFDGSANVSITAVVGNNSHTHSDSTIDGLNASAITAGTFAVARIPALAYISSTAPQNVAANSFAAHRVRNIWIGGSTPSSSGRQTGDIWFDTDG